MGDLYESSVDDDQHFLLFFIMGTYFGPDLKGEEPQLSVLKRIAEGLPPYTSNQLAGSHIKTVELEQVYYYVLRKADQSFVVNIPLMYQFFHGILPTDEQDPAANYPQFSDLFPPLFHPHLQFKNQYRIVKNIVFINNPETFYINKEDIERFKRLTRLDGFLLDKDAARSHAIPDCGVLCYGAVQVADPNEESPSLRLPLKSRKTRRIDDLLECSNLPDHDHVISPTETDLDPEKSVGPAMIFLPSLPAKTEWSNIVTAARSGFALTGSAAIGKVGPIIGLTDIGECEDAYLFRVCLPGVERDERQFSCEVESNGKVQIRGVTTTGEKMVYRYSQVFEMQTQNLSPPGHFSISFRLPGPVDPQQFSGSFGIDGILEGIVMKGRDAC